MLHGTLIVERRAVGPFAMNCHLVGCKETGKGALIDVGGDVQGFIQLAEKHQLDIEKLLLTHGHIDHIAGLMEMKDATGAPIYLHMGDKTIFDTAPQQGLFFGLRVPEPPAVDHELVDDQIIEIGNLRAKVLHTPGHSAGSVCFYFETPGVLFSGDLLFQGSIGRTDLPGANQKDMKKSLARVAELPDDTVVYPGHMGHTTIGMEKRSNPFLSEDGWW